jgi:dihydrofolate reductase
MRKLVLYTLLSLDGVAESPERYVYDFDDEMYANLSRTIGAQDAVLLGRRTYDGWAPTWPTSDHEPFASFINGVRKYVVTSTQPSTGWTNATVVTDAVPQFVRDLKKQPGRDIGVHGSIRLARSLIEAGLVDELRLVVTPVAAGRGRKLFPDDDTVRTMNLLRAVATPSGAILADYELRSRAGT